MKIWIDFINTPQVSFWVPFIKEFKNDNHTFIFTCRNSGNTIELLKDHGLNFQIIGNKPGNTFIQKLMLFHKRLFKLYSFISKDKPDIAASQSSFYQPIVARFLNIPCLYTNDNEHAKGNLFGFLFAKKVILPIALANEDFTKKWPLNTKISFYPSVKEAIYLSQNPTFLKLNSKKKNTIYFRPEPWSAQYYNGPLNFFDETLLLLASEYKVVILPRDKNQSEHYRETKFSSISVLNKPMDLADIISDCLLFIGAGGSMTRELAVIGIPVISIYQAKMLCVDKYLIDKGCLQLKPDITYDEIKSILQASSKTNQDYSVYYEGEVSFQLLKRSIINLKHE